MQDEATIKSVEEQVKRMEAPLKELIESLEPEIRPSKRCAYNWGDDWDDDFGEWADDTPPPWEGEDRLID